LNYLGYSNKIGFNILNVVICGFSNKLELKAPSKEFEGIQIFGFEVQKLRISFSPKEFEVSQVFGLKVELVIKGRIVTR
jgi:hypothetical protein